MAINFHSEINGTAYSKRVADENWVKLVNSICDVKGKEVLDIGCGGGIYTKAFAEMGAARVTGFDFSAEQLLTAKKTCKDYSNIDYRQGNALDTKLNNESYDIVLERAIIHHIKDLNLCIKEIFRVLKPGGAAIIQDRTPEDCLLKGSTSHIRGYFFEKFPDLIKKETSRRHSSEKVINELKSEGFQKIDEMKLWEIRKSNKEANELIADLKARTGRSILHELTDDQLEELVHYVTKQFEGVNHTIVEKDRWTVWIAWK
ncbi:class I SAM-dependent methyltransferase [Cytobacillus purgationiresistens]|uniref:2-polyprenyl-3-methyl-5-hydroxy-6-metoxy-1, 4-benzoquinol methylase n=1 Tax=Cytobacillus purgationiresistens TaxID=863449 RepID=A0ABU0ANH8_9BACI|nr:methyltransferase domain-containing protein [Cytobacillus purgationiresistens]MDQ0272844.1 2-polyprenyl-3-methyl-5-hydroxy-6-metoxy-1,4-benzoquinol methylase [Cytobacillus purgationiresistens]